MKTLDKPQTSQSDQTPGVGSSPAGEFGHVSSVGKINGHLCFTDAWGIGPFVIEVEGKRYRFEDSDRFGPHLCKRNGAICANPWPPERSPFWRAHSFWVKLGRKVAEDGITCVFELTKPRPNKFYRIDKRNIMLVEAGDEDGEYIEVEKPAGVDTP